MPKDNLYDYYIHYNSFTDYWHAVKRGRTTEYHNGTLEEGEILKNKDINQLIKVLSTTK